MGDAVNRKQTSRHDRSFELEMDVHVGSLWLPCPCLSLLQFRVGRQKYVSRLPIATGRSNGRESTLAERPEGELESRL